MTPQEVAGRLRVQVKLSKSNGGLLAICPAHDDRQASLSIDVGSDGKPLMKCMAGCDSALVLNRCGLSWSDLLAEPASAASPAAIKRPTLAAIYDYHNATGERLKHQTVRFEPKGFSQRQPCPQHDGPGCRYTIVAGKNKYTCDDGYLWTLAGVEPVLYRLPLLVARAEDVVFVVEGEKDADNLAALDLLATTSPMGAGKWRASYSETLRGRHVVILPDNDDTGRKHAQQVAAALQGVAGSVKVLDLADLPEKGDATDWLAAGHTAAELLALAEQTPEWRPSATIIEFPGREPEQPEFRRAGLGYVFEPKEHAVRLHCDYVRHRADDISAEVDAEQYLPGYPSGRIARGRLNFGAPKSVQAHADLLAKESDESVPWRTLLRAFVDLVVDAEREGEPFLKIGRRDLAPQPWLIEGMWRQGKLHWWYGPRASVKSQLAALKAICLQQGRQFLGQVVQKTRVGILDWEDDDIEWERVIQQVARGLDIEPPEIFYRQCSRPLKVQANAIARMADSEGLGALIVDSFGLAAGGTAEHSSFDETARTFAETQKELGLSMCVIDHVTHQARRNPSEAADPFGSQYKLALARSGFEIRKVQDEGSRTAHVGVFDRKHRRLPAIGVRVEWHDDTRITFDLEDLQEEETELAASIPLPRRIEHCLQHGELTVEEIAELLGTKPDPVRVALNRGRGKRFTKREQTGAWGLVHLASSPQVEGRYA
jgi:hypothetical protein